MTIKNTVLNPVNKTRLHEEIVSQIQKKILTGELKVGVKLPPERELAANLNVNRATVREALKKLEQLRLVDINHGDGIYVRDYRDSDNFDLLNGIINMNNEMTTEIVINVLELRKILVPKMAYTAAERITDNEFQKLEAIIIDTTLPVMERDLLVHKMVGRASKNLPYQFILNFFEQLFRDYGPLYFEIEENRKVSEKFHIDILKALKHKEADQAENLMRDVLIYTENRIFERFNIGQ